MANQVTNIGGMLSAVTTTIAYTNSTAVTIATLPANAQIQNVHIDVTTAFNAGTTNTVAYVASTSVGSTGRASVATTGVYSAWADTGSSEVSATITYSQTGTAATAGALRVTIVYKYVDV